MDTRERLTHLMDISRSHEPGQRRTLALELATLLLECPPDRSGPVALVLEKAVVRLDAETRALLATRLASDVRAPLGLLNELFFDAGGEARGTILARIAEGAPASDPSAKIVDEAALVAAVRRYPRGTFVHVLSRMFGIPAATAARIVVDTRGEGLAILCKGANLSRAAYSTLALLTDATPDRAEQRLESYENVAHDVSVRFVAFWRSLCTARSAGSAAGQAA